MSLHAYFKLQASPSYIGDRITFFYISNFTRKKYKYAHTIEI